MRATSVRAAEGDAAKSAKAMLAEAASCRTSPGEHPVFRSAAEAVHRSRGPTAEEEAPSTIDPCWACRRMGLG